MRKSRPVQNVSVADEFLAQSASEQTSVGVLKLSAHEFIFKYAKTLDPKNKRGGVNLFPDHPYLHSVLDSWLANDMTAIVKSRQMIISWLMVAAHLHLAMSNTGRLVFFQSKKEDDAGFGNDLALLARAKFMLDNAPKGLCPRYEYKLKPPQITFPEINSTIVGLSQESEAVRQYSASAILSDELAFQEQAKRRFEAMMAALQGSGDQAGGKFTAISTPNGRLNLFHDIVHDVITMEGGEIKKPADIQSELVPVMKGLQSRKNRNTDFMVLWLHYSADPTKDTEWVKHAKRKYTEIEAWNREMELSFSTSAGKRVYPQFSRNFHIEKCLPEEGRPIWRCWDFGFRHPACIWFQINHRGRISVLREILGEDIQIYEFATKVIDISKKFYQGFEFRDAGDPAGRQVNDKSAATTFDILRKYGVRMQARKMDPLDRVRIVRKLLYIDPELLKKLRTDQDISALMDAGEFYPMFKIDPQCTELIDGFLGGYVLEENIQGGEVPAKDGYYEHLHEAFQYGVAVCFDKIEAKPIVPRAAYYRPQPTANAITGY